MPRKTRRAVVVTRQAREMLRWVRSPVILSQATDKQWELWFVTELLVAERRGERRARRKAKP